MLSLARNLRPLIRRSQARNFFVIIPQTMMGFRQTLGSGRVSLQPGIHLDLPFIHHVYPVHMRETGLNISNMQCFTEDNVPVEVSGTAFYRVTNPELAAFSVEDLSDSVGKVAASAVRSLMGRFPYDHIIRSRNEINSELVKIIGDSIDKWGVECTTFEMDEFGPGDESTKINMKKQMEAERSRRETELNTRAAINEAQGKMESEKHKADGKAYEVRTLAESDVVKAQKAADALASRVDRIKHLLPHLSDQEVAEFIIEEKRLEHLSNLALSPNNKMYFIDPKSSFPSIQAAFDKQ